MIYVVFGDLVFQQFVGIPMGSNYAPLFADLFLYSYEAEFVQKLLRDENGKLAVSYRYIDDVLSINNYNFHNYVHLIYHNGHHRIWQICGPFHKNSYD
jgi:hypothetical protein